MKKLMTILLGLSLVIGTATVALSQGKEEPKKEKKAKTKKAKKTVEKQ
jgi:hypothetical protein